MFLIHREAFKHPHEFYIQNDCTDSIWTNNNCSQLSIILCDHDFPNFTEYIFQGINFSFGLVEPKCLFHMYVCIVCGKTLGFNWTMEYNRSKYDNEIWRWRSTAKHASSKKMDAFDVNGIYPSNDSIWFHGFVPFICFEILWLDMGNATKL